MLVPMQLEKFAVPWLFILGVVAASTAAEPLKSSIQPGEKIATIFEPLNITGEHAGELHCLVCENGRAPVAMEKAANKLAIDVAKKSVVCFMISPNAL